MSIALKQSHDVFQIVALERMRTGYVEDQPGFSQKRQEEILIAAGVPARRICGKGHNAATLDDALRLLRGDEVLECAAGLRALGSSRIAIMEAHALVRKAGRAILDPETGMRSDRDGAEMLDRALAKIRYEKTMPSEGRAKEIGALGGKARAAQIREGRLSETKAKAIWFNIHLSTGQAIERMPGWSKETAYRYFGKRGRKPGPAQATAS